MSEPRDTVRLLTGLTTGELDDTTIDALLDLNGGSVKLAAANALENVAGQLVDVDSDDIKLTGSRRAPVLMARAARLRTEVSQAADDDALFFDVVSTTGRGHGELAERRCW